MRKRVASFRKEIPTKIRKIKPPILPSDLIRSIALEVFNIGTTADIFNFRRVSKDFKLSMDNIPAG